MEKLIYHITYIRYMKYPDWVLKHKVKGTELRKKGNSYYLYKVTSIWDKERKKPKKITQKFLGTITREGLIKPRHERLFESMKHISVKEFGATSFIVGMNNDVVEKLKEVYPKRWKEIFVFAVFRFLNNSPIKNLQAYYANSFLSETLSGAHLSQKPVGELLRDLGRERGRVKMVLRSLISGTEFALVDLTHVLSLSEGVVSSVTGFNSKRDFSPQVHLIFLFSLDYHMPSYFRMIPGSIRDVSSLVLTVREAGVKNAVLIGDKGFFSEDNVLDLEEEGKGSLHYIFPLKRDSTLIDYSKIRQGDKRSFDGYFRFDNRVIWQYSYHVGGGALKGKKIVVFLDERLKTEEEKDYIARMEDNKDSKKTIEDFYEIQYRQGTIAVITDLDDDAERIYTVLKSRSEIETMFDVFKNVLQADRAYMRNDYQMEGWMFINFLALVFYYKTYGLLSDNDLLKRYSPKDVLIHLSRIHKLKIQDQWITSEIPKKTRDILEKLNLPIT